MKKSRKSAFFVLLTMLFLLVAAASVSAAPKVSVTGVKLNRTSGSLAVGASYRFQVTVSPSNATDKRVTWSSSNTKIATVDSTGRMTAKAAGRVTITAKAADGSGKSASCVVTVKQPVTAVKLNRTSGSLVVGANYKFQATISPSNATDKRVTWSSSNTKIATVDSTGRMTAKAVGRVTITAKAADGSGKSASCVVTVKKAAGNTVYVSSVKLNRTSGSLAVGANYKFQATVSPSNATDKRLTWSSSDTKIATVDSTGRMTAKAAGRVTITAKAADGSGKSASCVVTVKQPVTAVKLNRTSGSLVVGASYKFQATISPSNATDKRLTWSSSDTKIATVDSTGRMTAKAAGRVTITAKAADGSGKSASCVVTVKQAAKLVTGISLHRTSMGLSVGESAVLLATVSPADAANKKLVWSSSDTKVAVVDENGNVTAKAAGSATVTAKAADGSGKSASCAVTVWKDVREMLGSAMVLTLDKTSTVTVPAKGRVFVSVPSGHYAITIKPQKKNTDYTVRYFRNYHDAGDQNVMYGLDSESGTFYFADSFSNPTMENVTYEISWNGTDAQKFNVTATSDYFYTMLSLNEQIRSIRKFSVKSREVDAKLTNEALASASSVEKVFDAWDPKTAGTALQALSAYSGKLYELFKKYGIDKAQPIKLGTPVSVAYKDDALYYSFTPTESGTYTFIHQIVSADLSKGANFWGPAIYENYTATNSISHFNCALDDYSGQSVSETGKYGYCVQNLTAGTKYTMEVSSTYGAYQGRLLVLKGDLPRGICTALNELELRYQNCLGDTEPEKAQTLATIQDAAKFLAHYDETKAESLETNLYACIDSIDAKCGGLPWFARHGIDTAQPIQLNTPVTVSAKKEGWQQYYYSFTASEDGDYELVLKAKSETSVYDMNLYRGYECCAESMRGEKECYLEMSLEAGEKCTVEVWGPFAGEYELTVMQGAPLAELENAVYEVSTLCDDYLEDGPHKEEILAVVDEGEALLEEYVYDRTKAQAVLKKLYAYMAELDEIARQEEEEYEAMILAFENQMSGTEENVEPENTVFYEPDEITAETETYTEPDDADEAETETAAETEMEAEAGIEAETGAGTGAETASEAQTEIAVETEAETAVAANAAEEKTE